MEIQQIDHLVLTVAKVENTIRFYVEVLGMKEIDFGEGRKALAFEQQKINLHQKGAEVYPNAFAATPGSADICLITVTPLAKVIEELASRGVAIELGPVERTGARGRIESVYVRDPDRNLVEISNYL
jgi:catechol 2,3-dioxygenase-like lactoylglutathione lyase family enzyme